MHYPGLGRAMERFEGKEFTGEEILEADRRLFDLNERYHEEKAAFEAGATDKTLEQITFEKNMELQDFWEDTFGEDTWDDRHEIMPRGDSK